MPSNFTWYGDRHRHNSVPVNRDLAFYRNRSFVEIRWLKILAEREERMPVTISSASVVAAACGVAGLIFGRVSVPPCPGCESERTLISVLTRQYADCAGGAEKHDGVNRTTSFVVLLLCAIAYAIQGVALRVLQPEPAAERPAVALPAAAAHFFAPEPLAGEQQLARQKVLARVDSVRGEFVRN